MKMPPSTTHTLTEHPQLMQRICRAIAIRRQLERETLPPPEGWQCPPQSEQGRLLVGLAILFHLAAWIFVLWLNHLAAR